jgi:3-oxoacyl-[acyl-carrier protein] reductase
MPTASEKMCSGHVAIVTGGSGGIGREVARTLASRGYGVVVSYTRSQRDADAVVEEITAAAGTALTVRADVTDELDVERLFTETIEMFGGIDVVVHAAARRMTSVPVIGYDLGSVDALLRANVHSTFAVNQQAARDVRDGGAIVNVSGAGGATASPTGALDALSTAAVNAFTQVLARELRPRAITVNAIAPGPHAPGTSSAVGPVVAFLVSEDGHAINGQLIQIQ